MLGGAEEEGAVRTREAKGGRSNCVCEIGEKVGGAVDRDA